METMAMHLAEAEKAKVAAEKARAEALACLESDDELVNSKDKKAAAGPADVMAAYRSLGKANNYGLKSTVSNATCTQSQGLTVAQHGSLTQVPPENPVRRVDFLDINDIAEMVQSRYFQRHSLPTVAEAELLTLLRLPWRAPPLATALAHTPAA
jgi:hypothetical protein